MVYSSVRIIEGKFMLLVAEELRNPYAVELYRVLSIFVVIDYILILYPYLTINIAVLVRSDCQSVINRL